MLQVHRHDVHGNGTDFDATAALDKMAAADDYQVRQQVVYRLQTSSVWQHAFSCFSITCSCKCRASLTAHSTAETLSNQICLIVCFPHEVIPQLHLGLFSDCTLASLSSCDGACRCCACGHQSSVPCCCLLSVTTQSGLCD